MAKNNIPPNFPEIVSRSMYCENCERHHRPRNGTVYSVYGEESNEHKLFIHKERFIPEKNRGISPHLIIHPKKVRGHSGLWRVEVRCCVNHCGLQVRRTLPKKNEGFKIALVEFGPSKIITLTEADLVGLYDKDNQFHLEANKMSAEEMLRISIPMSKKESSLYRCKTA